MKKLWEDFKEGWRRDPVQGVLEILFLIGVASFFYIAAWVVDIIGG